MKGLKEIAAAMSFELVKSDRPCSGCGEIGALGDTSFCERCWQVKHEHGLRQSQRAEMKAKRICSAMSICPAEYRNTDPKRLPNPVKAAEALAWKYGSSGLILHGLTGSGKSRTAWLVVQDQIRKGRSALAVTAYDLSFKLPALYSTGADAVLAWVDRICAVDLLLLDDVFKGVLNERAETFLFTVYTKRNESMLPCITTLNDTSETLAARLTFDRSGPLLRRIRDYATAIAL